MGNLEEMLKAVIDFRKRFPAPRAPVITLWSGMVFSEMAERSGMGIYPVLPGARAVSELYGIPVFTDTTLAPGEMKITDEDGNTLTRIVSIEGDAT